MDANKNGDVLPSIIVQSVVDATDTRPEPIRFFEKYHEYMAALVEDNKINFIKQLRTDLHTGLKESKDIADKIFESIIDSRSKAAENMRMRANYADSETVRLRRELNAALDKIDNFPMSEERYKSLLDDYKFLQGKCAAFESLALTLAGVKPHG